MTQRPRSPKSQLGVVALTAGVAQPTPEYRITKQAVEQARQRGYEPPHEWQKERLDPFVIIFSHDFAKAFWGEGELLRQEQPPVYEFDGRYSPLPRWQYHLREMVLCENPFDYLAPFLKEVGSI